MVSDVICSKKVMDTVVLNEKSVYGVTELFITKYDIRSLYNVTRPKLRIALKNWKVLRDEYIASLMSLKNHGISEKTIIRVLAGYDINNCCNSYSKGINTVKNEMEFMLWFFNADPTNNINKYNRK